MLPYTINTYAASWNTANFTVNLGANQFLFSPINELMIMNDYPGVEDAVYIFSDAFVSGLMVSFCLADYQGNALDDLNLPAVLDFADFDEAYVILDHMENSHYATAIGLLDSLTKRSPVVPEPASILLLGLGIAGMAGLRKRNR